MLHMLRDFFSFAIQPPPDPRFYMLHVLRDFSHAHGPSAQPPFYMLHMLPGLFRFLHSLVHATYACLSCSTCSIQIFVPSSVPPARRSRITGTPGMPGIGF